MLASGKRVFGLGGCGMGSWVVGFLSEPACHLAFRISKAKKFTLAKNRTPKEARSFRERRNFEYWAGKNERKAFFSYLLLRPEHLRVN